MPTKSSLSFTVADLYTETTVSISPGNGKVRSVEINENVYSPQEKPFKRVQQYIDKLAKYVSKDVGKYDYRVKSYNNFPTAAGFASSASGFATLATSIMKCLSYQHSWAEEVLKDKKKLSAIARLGSGSASRSVSRGVILWERGWDRGDRFDPLWDSYASQVLEAPEDVLLVYVMIGKEEKKISSRDAMRIARDTSPLYWKWVEDEEKGLEEDIRLLQRGKWEEFIRRVMVHSDAAHAILRSSFPSIEYLTDRSIELKERVIRFNAEYGNMAAYTFEAGPNPVIVVLKDVVKDLEKEVMFDTEYIITKPV